MIELVYKEIDMRRNTILLMFFSVAVFVFGCSNNQGNDKQPIDKNETIMDKGAQLEYENSPKLIIDQAKKIKEQKNKEEYQILQELHALVKPGMKRELVYEILGHPNSEKSYEHFKLVKDVDCYHFHDYNACLAYENNVLVDNIEDLLRLAADKYNPDAPYTIRALNRLKELGKYQVYAQFFEGNGNDMQIFTAEVLGRIDEPVTIPYLINGLRQNNRIVSGSENATIHQGLKEILIKTLDMKTGKVLWNPERFNNPEYISACINKYREWLKQHYPELEKGM
jgi:hypothetical protein